MTASPAVPPENLQEYMLTVLDVFAFDECDSLFWRTDSDYAPLQFFVICSDVFFWATADLEPIGFEDLDLLRQAKADSPSQFPTLFCARKRGMRPQGALYKYLPENEWPLFDACGPARDVDPDPFGNPESRPA